MRFGLALSGGGLRGVAHIGVLKALEEYRLRPSWISGASAGSIVAGLYAYGYSPNQMEELALNLDRRYIDPDVCGIVYGVLQLVMGKEPITDGIIKGKYLERFFNKLTKGAHIREVKIPLAISAVDINTAKTIMFVSSKEKMPPDDHHTQYIDDVYLYEAIRASIAIPVIFKPMFIQNMRLVDGGVTENLPIDVLRKMGAKKILGVDLGYSGQIRKGVNNIFEIGSQAIDIMAYQITRLKSEGIDFILRPGIYDVSLSDVDKIPEIIKRGYEATIENIKMIKKALNS